LRAAEDTVHCEDGAMNYLPLKRVVSLHAFSVAPMGCVNLATLYAANPKKKAKLAPAPQ